MQFPFRLLILVSLVLSAICLPKTAALAQTDKTAPAEKSAPSPWGISSSAGSRKTHDQWFPLMEEAGVKTVRSFPTWSNVEPKKDQWNWTQCDEMIAAAEKNGLELNGILMGKCPWTAGGIPRFPMENLDDWASYVEQIVGRYKGKVTYWEVWNEGNA